MRKKQKERLGLRRHQMKELESPIMVEEILDLVFPEGLEKSAEVEMPGVDEGENGVLHYLSWV